MISTGIDIIEISRIENSLKKDNRFIAKYFGEDEQQLFKQRKNAQTKIQTIAVNFSAKEAFSKALGTGVRDFSLNEVEILRNDLGAPYIKLSGKARALVEKKNASLSVSLSHTDTYATAIVVMYDNK